MISATVVKACRTRRAVFVQEQTLVRTMNSALWTVNINEFESLGQIELPKHPVAKNDGLLTSGGQPLHRKSLICFQHEQAGTSPRG